MYTDKRPLVCGHESLGGIYQANNSPRPLIAKIHRDIFLNLAGVRPQRLRASQRGWVKALTDIFKIYTPVVIGYGGNDGNLMGFLKTVETIEGGIFWC